MESTEITSLEANVKLEMLVGRLSDLLIPAREIAQFRLQANSSVTTRSKLQHFVEVTGAVWEQLNGIQQELVDLRERKSG